jgi:hypothetical protein
MGRVEIGGGGRSSVKTCWLWWKQPPRLMEVAMIANAMMMRITGPSNWMQYWFYPASLSKELPRGLF